MSSPLQVPPQRPCRSGWPSAVRAGVNGGSLPRSAIHALAPGPRFPSGQSFGLKIACAAVITGSARTSAIAHRRARRLMLVSLPRELVLELVRVALVFEQLDVGIDSSIQDRTDVPRPREDLRVFDRHVVAHVVRTNRRVPFDDVQLVAVVVAGAIEPG